jgi:hypothetical protein
MRELILKNPLRKIFIIGIEHYKHDEIIRLNKSSQNKVVLNTIKNNFKYFIFGSFSFTDKRNK